MKDRERKKEILVESIKRSVSALKKLGYIYSDCASEIVLFDDKMYKKPFDDMTVEERQKVMIDTLY